MTAPIVRIEAGDMLAVLPRLIAEGIKVHAVVCDPPYHLQSIVRRFGSPDAAPAKVGATGAYARASAGFMGKTWDGGDIAFRPETWRLCYDLLPPGGHLLAFAGTRTYHRIACAIEDAGFEIRDMLAWLYGSGFPKSHNVGKAIDRAAGAEREIIGPNPTYRAMQVEASAYNLSRNPNLTASATDDARAWEGWGTALKPALEPLCIARKPLAGTVAANVLAHGTGAFNIDACRIDASGRPDIAKRNGQPDTDGHQIFGNGLSPGSRMVGTTDTGRWPANVAHDGSAEVVDAFPDGASTARENKGAGLGYGSTSTGDRGAAGYADSGNASRFFYSSKADEGDRLDSKHPTVKPVDLIRWLVRLVTPPGGTVLDPFAGSGTTAMACMAEGFDCIVVEREPEYVADIRRRVAHVHGTDTPLFGGAK